MKNLLLSAKNVEKFYGEGEKRQEVLRGVTAEFQERKSYVITGVSGSGKSTLLHILGGLDEPTSGAVFFGGDNISRLGQRKKEQFLNSSIGFVFQFHYLINEFSVMENIMLPGLVGGKVRELCKKRSEELLEHIGLLDKSSSYPFELSGGEQQRVSILRAIFNKPKFLLADEPTGNLDAFNAKRIMDLIIRCQKEWGLGLIICSHDPAVYSQMETVLELESGKVREIS